MKHNILKILFLITSFGTNSLVFSKGWIIKVSPQKLGAVAEVETYNHYAGQKLVILQGGKEVGRATFLKFMPDKKYGLLKVTEGKVLEGFIIEDATLYDEGIYSLDKEKDPKVIEEKENETFFERKTLLVSLLGGYDYQLADDLLNGGLSGALILAYKTPVDFSLGARIGYSRIDLNSVSTTVNGVKTTVDLGSMNAVYYLLRAGYHFSKHFYIGGNFGFLNYSYEGVSGNEPIYGGEVAFDFYFSNFLSFTVNASASKVIKDNIDYTNIAGHGGLSFWF